MAKHAKRKPAKSPAPAPARKSAAADADAPSKAPGGLGAWKWPLVLAFGVAALASGSIWYKATSPDPAADSPDGAPSASMVSSTAAAAAPHFPDNTGPEAGYSGSDSCAECHKSIAESYSHIAMGRSLYPPTADNIIEDYDQNNEFFHEPSGIYYRMTHEDGKFYQASFQKDPKGQVINQNKVQVTYVVGSGNNSRSYIHRQPDGKVYQLPVAWYPEEKRWAMNPGYDNPNQINFSRRITYDCLSCHAAYPNLKAGEDQNNYGESSFFPEHLEAIDCERCHGPAQKHVDVARSGATAEVIRQTIVNPGNLSNELQMEVCMQCHLETTSGNLPHSVHTIGKGIFGYRPGEPLEEYRYAFDHPPGTGHDDKFEIAGQAYRLRKSACFIQSEGKMTCTTCHDPHKIPKDRITAAIQSCFECHQPADCTEKMELRLPVKDNCITCHMPQRRTDDVIHVTMTDHFIQRRPPPPEQLLAPKQEHASNYRGDVLPYYPEEFPADKRDLYLGLAHVANSADLEKGIAFLDAALKQSNESPFAPVYTRGVALKLLGRLNEARTGLEDAVKLRPDHPQAWMALGDLYEQMKNYPRSIECYQTAARLDPRLSRAQNGLGTSLMLSGDHDAAAQAFRKAITLDPFDDNAHLNLSGIYLQSGQFDAAEAEARAALAVNPNRPAGWGHLAQCAMGKKQPAQAIWPILEAIKLDGAEMQNGEILAEVCKTAPAGQALAALDEVTTRSPFAALAARAFVVLRAGDTAAATSALQKAAQHTTRTSALPTAAQAALECQRADLALLWSSQLVQAVPDNDTATVLYASALRATRQEEQAAATLEQALTRGRSPRTLNALAWLRATAHQEHHRNGSQASALLNEAMQAMGNANVFLLQTQAAVAAENGDMARATTLAEQALQMATSANLVLEVKKIEAQLAAYRAGRAYRSNW